MAAGLLHQPFRYGFLQAPSTEFLPHIHIGHTCTASCRVVGRGKHVIKFQSAISTVFPADRRYVGHMRSVGQMGSVILTCGHHQSRRRSHPPPLSYSLGTPMHDGRQYRRAPKSDSQFFLTLHNSHLEAVYAFLHFIRKQQPAETCINSHSGLVYHEAACVEGFRTQTERN